MRRLQILLILVLSINLNAQTTRYVSKTSTPLPPYTSWETASRTIKGCMEISNFGDTVYIGEGVFESL